MSEMQQQKKDGNGCLNVIVCIALIGLGVFGVFGGLSMGTGQYSGIKSLLASVTAIGVGISGLCKNDISNIIPKDLKLSPFVEGLVKVLICHLLSFFYMIPFIMIDSESENTFGWKLVLAIITYVFIGVLLMKHGNDDLNVLKAFGALVLFTFLLYFLTIGIYLILEYSVHGTLFNQKI